MQLFYLCLLVIVDIINYIYTFLPLYIFIVKVSDWKIPNMTCFVDAQKINSFY